MRIIKAKIIVFGLLATVASSIAIIVLISARESPVKRRVRAITSIESLEALAGQLGKPDAISIQPTDIQGVPLSLAFDYLDHDYFLHRKRQFPFFKLSRSNKLTRIHILALDKLSELPQINEDLLKSYWWYHHAVVPTKYSYEIPLNLAGCVENDGRYKSQLRQMKQNIGLQVDAAARRD